ncbi:hypothetical protein PICMEDRAFT_64960 [Pichia membranifaciens NRRL Y-2026]|uniref:Uncharacterized protein n=1 Tax=Pichia membranifaciens NRRL Y-2026 TaxID=763406 RepID=A0A1E3NGU9_9ASCO|nr:hypothetical protein PICMEDRAFT_64960 [Pichia membranifaciens NRRL Y-2026]ODQ45339.1 hypothetical protein PICMEDRAFT_64960 [Pichia membranifaciens NRRL Y-2026]
MENIEWEELDNLAMSSPKKRLVQAKPNHGSTAPPREGNNNIELGEFNLEFFDKQLANSRSLSPVRLPSRNGTSIANKEEKVTSFQKDHSGSGLSGNSLDKSTHKHNSSGSSDEEVVNISTSSSSNKSEAEIAIQKVKDFIESKRKMIKKDTNVTGLRTSSSKKVGKAEPGRRGPGKVKAKINPSQHRKNLRRLIHEIHKLPYNSDWNAKEWHLLQEYLNEWKLSEDDDMFQPVVLRDLFNCTVSELEIRIGSLRKFVRWKKKKVQENVAN